VRDQLGEDLSFVHVPDCARRVDARGADQLLVVHVPVEGGQRGRELGLLRG
jgi:hypothetical protein